MAHLGHGLKKFYILLPPFDISLLLPSGAKMSRCEVQYNNGGKKYNQYSSSARLRNKRDSITARREGHHLLASCSRNKWPEHPRGALMMHLYLCLPDQCGQKIHKSKKDRRFLFVQFFSVCLLYSYFFTLFLSAPVR